MKIFRMAPRLAVMATVGLMAFLAPQTLRAQPRCWGSSVVYLVRDEKGKRIEADADDLWVGPGWEVVDYDFGDGWVPLPAQLRSEIGNLKFLVHIERTGACQFTKPIELRLTLHGKSMNLVFQAERKTNVFVDSLPFQEGTYEHPLSPQPGEQTRYWLADGWKKTGDSAEAVAHYPLAFIRGRVIDSANGKPVSDARIILKSNIRYREAATNTNAKGAFQLKVRADRFEKATGVAVIAMHPDYLDDFAIAVENRKGGPLETVDNVTLKLVHTVTVSGRIIDEKTGAVMKEPDEIKLKTEFEDGKKLWGEKFGGETDYTPVNPDGTFSIKTAAGKIQVTSIDSAYRVYTLMDDPTELDVGPKGLSNVVLKFKKF